MRQHKTRASQTIRETSNIYCSWRGKALYDRVLCVVPWCVWGVCIGVGGERIEPRTVVQGFGGRAGQYCAEDYRATFKRSLSRVVSTVE